MVCCIPVWRAPSTIMLLQLLFSVFLIPVSNVSISLLLLRTQPVSHAIGNGGNFWDPPWSRCGVLYGLDIDPSEPAGWVGRLRGGGRAWIRKTITKERKKETQRKKRNIGNTNLVASVSLSAMLQLLQFFYYNYDRLNSIHLS